MSPRQHCYLFMAVLLIGQLIISGPSIAATAIKVNGSGSALDMMKPLVTAYTKANPGVTVEIDKPLGSSGAIKALLANAIDIAVSSKQLRPEDIASGARSHEYGRTPLAFVVNKSVTKRDITTAELEAIYSGRMVTWPHGEQLRLVLRPESDIDSTIIRNLSPALNKAYLEALRRPGMTMAITDPESNELVVRSSGALGASGLTGVIAADGQLATLSLNGVKPTVAALVRGDYPLAKEIRFVTTDRISAESRKFLDFVQSAKGREIAGKVGVQVYGTPRGSK